MIWKPMPTPSVLTVSSHVVRGTVGNRAAAFVLQAMGFSAWVVPTIVLPWHPGHGPASKIIPASAEFNALIGDLRLSPKLTELGVALSGYFANSDQVRAVAELIFLMKEKVPEFLYVLDPVIGDNDRLYVDEKTALAMRDHLLPLADIVTPNRFELTWLTGSTGLVGNANILNAARRLKTKTVLITSAEGETDGNIGNLLLHGDHSWLAEHPQIHGPSNGLGDLTSALLLANWLISDTAPACEILTRTTASVFDIMAHSAQANTDELAIEGVLESLLHPKSEIRTRQLELP